MEYKFIVIALRHNTHTQNVSSFEINFLIKTCFSLSLSLAHSLTTASVAADCRSHVVCAFLCVYHTFPLCFSPLETFFVGALMLYDIELTLAKKNFYDCLPPPPPRSLCTPQQHYVGSHSESMQFFRVISKFPHPLSRLWHDCMEANRAKEAAAKKCRIFNFLTFEMIDKKRRDSFPLAYTFTAFCSAFTPALGVFFFFGKKGNGKLNM